MEFDATLQDVVDVELRMLKRSAVARRWGRRDSIIIGTMSALGIFIVLGFVTPSPPMDFRIALSLGCMALFPFLFHRMHRDEGSLRAEQYFREQLGDGPIRIIVELRSEGAWVRQANVQMLFEWEHATAIEDTPGGVEMIFQRGGIVVVRDRAFESATQRTEFIERARDLMRAHNSRETPVAHDKR